MLLAQVAEVVSGSSTQAGEALPPWVGTVQNLITLLAPLLLAWLAKKNFTAARIIRAVVQAVEESNSDPLKAKIAQKSEALGVSKPLDRIVQKETNGGQS